MPQLTYCPHCGKSLQVPDSAAGKPIRCPICKELFAIRAVPVAVSETAVGLPNGATASRSGMAGAPTTVPNRVSPSFDAASSDPHNECPVCKARIRPGATTCAECGYLVQGDGLGIESEAARNLCPNPACGVANSAGDRFCQRCSSPLPMPVGTLLQHRYRIEKLIAIGGFGTVYQATDTKQSNRPVAIKDMICADPQEFRIRLSFFQREAEILRSLEKLPAVPRLYDFVQQGQSAYLVLEYICGHDLLKLMESNGNKPFHLDLVAEWGRAICDVLTHMHALSPPIVHRDLKPDNIMLLPDQRSIKMVDFGTARDVGRSQQTRLVAKTRVYTEGYAPPEQILGKPEARSDLFALAGTLYHLATGKAPEGFYTARELEAQLVDSKSAIPADQRWFFDLIKINLAEDVNDRYFSTREFKADLERRRVTKEICCPHCRASNTVRHPYCAKCAAPLTDLMPPCGHCNKQNRMGSRWCIYCGNRLR